MKAVTETDVWERFYDLARKQSWAKELENKFSSRSNPVKEHPGQGASGCQAAPPGRVQAHPVKEHAGQGASECQGAPPGRVQALVKLKGSFLNRREVKQKSRADAAKALVGSKLFHNAGTWPRVTAHTPHLRPIAKAILTMIGTMPARRANGG